ncbi:MAG TPA: FHA domain-containing protein [Jiangellales bacterium]|nr:FHA domain-containing protein [Jiangellales bacterium]
MSRQDPGCHLIVLDGPDRGSVVDVPVGRSEVGRLPGSAIALPDPTVSRRHAEVVRSSTGVSIRDLGSANGTYVNGLRLTGPRNLRDGDEVRLGTVTVRFSSGARRRGPAADPQVTPLPPAAARASTQPSAFGDVHGPVQTGSGRQYAAGRDQYVAHGDQFLDHSVNVQDDYDPWDEIWQGRGPGRVLMALGGILGLVGFGMFAYVVFSMFAVIGSDTVPEGPGDVFDVRLMIGGFALAVLGGVLAAIGSGMSKAARKREERRARERGSRPGTRERRGGR